MKRFILVILFVIFCNSIIAKSTEWVELQTIVLPEDTIINYTYKDDGSIKYFIVVEGITVNISKSNAQKFIRGECKLELVKWYNKVTNKYKYSIRQYNNNKNIDLSKIQFNHG